MKEKSRKNGIKISLRKPGKSVMPLRKAYKVLRMYGHKISQSGVSDNGAKGSDTKETRNLNDIKITPKEAAERM